MYKFNYTVQSTNAIFATDLPTREMARSELREIKALGYKDAKIIRQEYLLIGEKSVR